MLADSRCICACRLHAICVCVTQTRRRKNALLVLQPSPLNYIMANGNSALLLTFGAVLHAAYPHDDESRDGGGGGRDKPKPVHISSGSSR